MRINQQTTFFVVFLFVFFLCGQFLFAQESIKSHALREGNYIFDMWNEDAPAETYPCSMRFLTTKNDVRPSLYYRTFEFYRGEYRKRTRVSTVVGMGTDGISFSNTNAGKYFLCGAVLSLNTVGVKEIGVSWESATLKGSKSRWAIRLQYRIGNTGEWKDITDKEGKPVEYVNTIRSSKAKTLPQALLPEVCNNEHEVQLLWRLYYKGRKGVLPEMSLNRIKITSEIDSTRLYPPTVSITSPTNGLFERDTTCLRFATLLLNNSQSEEESLFLRCDSIEKSFSIHVEGEHADMFLVPQEISAKKIRKGARIPIVYTPKSKGTHHAKIVFTGGGQHEPIAIKLLGHAARLDSINTNLAKDHASLFPFASSFSFPVVSEKSYRFSFLPKFGTRESSKPLHITYTWYADTLLLSSFTDEFTRKGNQEVAIDSKRDENIENEYCIPLTAPRYANQVKIQVETYGETVTFEKLFFGEKPYKVSLRSGMWDNPLLWTDGEIPHIDDNVFISAGHTVMVEDDAFCEHLFLGDSAKVEIEDGNYFFVGSEVFYSQGSSIAVHQKLKGKTWNYICPPVANVRPVVFSMAESGNETWLMKYNTGEISKMGDYWSSYIEDPKYKLEEGVGYAVYTTKPIDVVYRGRLCNSEVSIPLEATKNDAWNLIGNPFTAPLSTQKLFPDINGRVQGNAIFLLDEEQGGYKPLVVEPGEEIVIAPSESFFVEALEGENIVMKRSQQHYVLGKQLSDCNGAFLTLNITNGDLSQYALFGTHNEASLGFDNHDAHKLFGYNSDLPEIYFQIGKEQVSVNVFPDQTAAFPICIYVGANAELTLDVGNLSLLDEGVGIYLEDTLLKRVHPLCHQSSYRFNLLQGTSCGRFILHYVKKTEFSTEKGDKFPIRIWYNKNHVYMDCAIIGDIEKIDFCNETGNCLKTYVPSSENRSVNKIPILLEKGKYSAIIKTKDFRTLRTCFRVD